MFESFGPGYGPGHDIRHRGHRKQADVSCGLSSTHVSCLSVDKLPYLLSPNFSHRDNDACVKGLRGGFMIIKGLCNRDT